MSTKKYTMLFGIFFLLAAVSGVLLFQEIQSHRETERALLAIVQEDAENVETFLQSESSNLRRWGDYLAISQLESSLESHSDSANEVLKSLSIKLRFAYGVEKYPVLTTLRDSLCAWKTWKETSVFRTVFEGATVPEKLVAQRRGQASGNLQLAQKQDSAGASEASAIANLTELEENFLEQTAAELPAPSAESIFEQDAVALVDALPDARSLEDSSENVVESPASEVRSKSSDRQNRKTLSPVLMARAESVTAVVAEQPEKSAFSVPAAQSLASDRSLRATPVVFSDSLAQSSVESEKIVKSEEADETEETDESGNANEFGKANESGNVAPEDILTVPELVLEEDACEKTRQSEKPVSGQHSPNVKTALEKAIPEVEIPVELESEPVESVQPADASKSSPTAAPSSVESSADVAHESALVAEHGTLGVIPVLPSLHFSLSEPLSQAVSALNSAPSTDASQPTLTGDFHQDAERLSYSWLKTEYRVPSESDLASAYEEVREAVNFINRLFAKTTPKKRQEWQKFLNWEVLHLEDGVDAEALSEVHRRLSCGAYGLELEFFVRLRFAIERYLALDAQMQCPDAARAHFEAGCSRMAGLLKLAQAEPSSQIQCALEDTMGWMEQMDQAPEMLALTAQLWSRPNVLATVSSTVFERFGSRFIEEEQEVRERIQRASLRGKVLFSGNLSVAPIFNEERVELGIVLDGASDSRTKAYAGPAIISTRAKSRIYVTKSIFFDENGFDSSAARAQIRTNSRIENVQDVFNRPFIESFATRRAFAKKDETEREANAQNSYRLRQRFDQTIEELLSDWNERFFALRHHQLEPRGLASGESRLWSDDAGVHAQAQFACRSGLTAPTLPPETSSCCDIQLAIHETAFQELFVGFLGGMNLNPCAREQFRNGAPEWLQKMLATSAEENTSEPSDWTLRFPQNWPVSASFEDGKITFCIHCTRMEYDGKTYPAVNITIVYAIEKRENEILLVRQGNIDILPPDFNPAVKKRLPSSMVSLRRVMGKRLEKALVKEIVLKETPIIANAQNSGSRFANLHVQPIFIQAESGWLQIGLNLSEKTPQCPPVQTCPQPEVTLRRP